MEQLLLDFANAISPALQTLLQGIAAVLATQAVAWMKQNYELKKAEISREHQYILEIVASSAVKAAEQLYEKDSNVQKRKYALDTVQVALGQYGIKLDLGTIVSAVESAVFSNDFPEQASG